MPASTHAGGSGPGCGHSISRLVPVDAAAVVVTNGGKCGLAYWYHRSVEFWRWLTMIASAPNSRALAPNPRSAKQRRVGPNSVFKEDTIGYRDARRKTSAPNKIYKYFILCYLD